MATRKLKFLMLIFIVLVVGAIVGWLFFRRSFLFRTKFSRPTNFALTQNKQALIALNSDKSLGRVTVEVFKTPYILDEIGYFDVLLLDKRPAKVAIELFVESYGFSDGVVRRKNAFGEEELVRKYRVVNLGELFSSIKVGDKVEIGLALTRNGYGANCVGNICERMDKIVDFTRRFVDNPDLMDESGVVLLGMASQFELLKEVAAE